MGGKRTWFNPGTVFYVEISVQKSLKVLPTFAKFSKINQNQHFYFLKNFTKFWQIRNSSNFLEKCEFRAVQRSALCRSRRELSNAYLLAKFGFDTAENEPSKVCRSDGDEPVVALIKQGVGFKMDVMCV